MKIVAVACARDEIDIIEPFVRHTLAFVSRLVVLDNGSTDGTLAVLEALRGEGLPLDVLEDRSLGKYLSKRVTRMMREDAIGRHRADWVLPLDVDEFIVVPGGGPLIPEGTAADAPLHWRWRTYVPDDGDDAGEINPVVRLWHRLAEEAWKIDKVLVPAALGSRPGAVVTQGNHALSIEGHACPGPDVTHAYLAHFPVRSLAQFISRTFIGYLQNEAMALRNPSAAAHYRLNYELLDSDPDAFRNRFTDHARLYAVPPSLAAGFVPRTVVDPLDYRSGPLRYTPVQREGPRTWQPILRYARGLAREYGLLKASLDADGGVSQAQQAEVFSRMLDHIADRDRTIEAQQRQLRFYEQSWAWRLGRLALKPLAWMARPLRRCLRTSA
jgi:hypothetical protein